MIQFIEQMMEQWDLTIWLKTSRDIRRYVALNRWWLESFAGKMKRTEERFQYCVKRSKHFLHFRAIQGHSGGTLVDPTLPDNVLLSDDFAEYIYHIGHVHVMHSIDSRRKVSKGQTGSHRFSQQGTRWISIKIWNRSHTISRNTESQCVKVFGKCNLLMQTEDRSKKRIAVLLNTIPGNRSFQCTTCELCGESGTDEDWEESHRLQGTWIPKATSCCFHVEFARYTSASYLPRSEDHQSEESVKY